MSHKKYEVVCFPSRKDPVRGWILEDGILMAKSRYGQAYKICKEKNCDYVIKLLKQSHRVINREICFQEFCAHYGLCKPVEDWWFCSVAEGEKPRGGIIITSLLHESLGDAAIRLNDDSDSDSSSDSDDEDGRRNMQKLLKKTLKLIFDLHQIKVIHGDAHPHNIMFDKKGRPFFIDMGRSQRFPQLKISILNDILEDYKGTMHGSMYTWTDLFRCALNDFNKDMKTLVKEGMTPQDAEQQIVKKIIAMPYQNELSGWSIPAFCKKAKKEGRY